MHGVDCMRMWACRIPGLVAWLCLLCSVELAPLAASLRVEHSAHFDTKLDEQNLRASQHFMRTGTDSSTYVEEAARIQNPGLCLKFPSDAFEKHGGTFPVEDFKALLANGKAPAIIKKNGVRDTNLASKLNVSWCPEPVSELVYTPVSVLEAKSYLEKALTGTDRNKPVVAVVGEVSSASSDLGHVQHLQMSNFICGMHRLGLSNQLVLLALSEPSARELRKHHQGLRVLYHSALVKLIQQASAHTNMGYNNRMAKLVLADVLLSIDREVLISDVDMHWFQDPTEYLQGLTTPSGMPVDFAAMMDICWLTVNSGFVYYRPTQSAKNLLRTTLSMRKWSDKGLTMASDNDQYLLNCGFARAAVSGLSYRLLPKASFAFGLAPRGSNKCHNKTISEGKVRGPSPMVWHTSGYSTPAGLKEALDTFAALGWIDLDARRGECLTGRRGSQADVDRAAFQISRLCDTSPGGVVSAYCSGDCAPEPKHAQSLLAEFLEGPFAPAAYPDALTSSICLSVFLLAFVCLWLCGCMCVAPCRELFCKLVFVSAFYGSNVTAREGTRPSRNIT
eukprot:gnl/TRDRNA2_/TRDRNA2_176592_c0_seq10.p1 gnl/TRDRNA2_/TRDRNA2_176592_c0~~gnl/TRDRNA2_/TRDRNA2_176592_c0_seq10.p1  ORF type:complete len:576 (-),score=21.29 gnl/TRDRNA2_/TRDRNA2_176592_c0_seq10:144-1829(-)